MSAFVQEIASEAEFTAATQSGIVLVDFFATWCGPCRMQGPILDQLAATIGEKAKIVKVDVDKLPAVAQKFSVSSVPTLVVFSNGQVVKRMERLQQADELKKALESA